MGESPLGLILRCVACSEKLDFREDRPTFPLCSHCSTVLWTAPKLCSRCGSPVCPSQVDSQAAETCTRPWLPPSAVDSYSALYLLLKTDYPVLRRWKTRRGILFDRRVLKSNPLLLQTWHEFRPEAVVPIPQNFSRSWKMRGSPAEVLARWVSSQLGIPYFPCLSASPRPRQAELGMQARLENPIRFTARASSNALWPKRLLLVDDFVTSGRTLREAAKALKMAGAEKVHGFSLGVKSPSQPDNDSQRDFP